MSRSKLELGVVYEHKARYYVAVGDQTLICHIDGKWHELKSHEPLRALRDVSVAAVCQRWGITLAAFDAGMAKHFAVESGAVQRPTAGRRRTWSETNWRALRTHRHSLERRAG